MAGRGVPGDPLAPRVEGLVRAVLGIPTDRTRAVNWVRWGIRTSGLFGAAEEGEEPFGKLDMSILALLLPHTGTFLASWRHHTPLP